MPIVDVSPDQGSAGSDSDLDQDSDLDDEGYDK